MTPFKTTLTRFHGVTLGRLVRKAAGWALMYAALYRWFMRHQDVTRDDHRPLGPFPLMGRPRIRRV